MANWFNISCKKATFLISKKQESKLAIGESLQLFIHLLICDVCKLFKTQTNYLLHNIKIHQQTERLNEAAKEKMATVVKDEISKS